MSAELLGLAASALGPLVDDVVFVGGATIHLWLTEPGAPPTRATEDVDVICNVASLGEYYKLAEQLRERGFAEVIEEPVICRWQHRETGLMLDLMPTEEAVLGFSNPWYELAVEEALKVSNHRRGPCDCNSRSAWTRSWQIIVSGMSRHIK